MTDVDIYDAMDAALPGVNSTAQSLAQKLKDQGFTILRVEDGDYDVDPDVHINERVSVQVCFDGSFSVNRQEGEGSDWRMHHSPYRTDINDLVEDLRSALDADSQRTRSDGAASN
jgi:hypothetical protein